MRNRKLYELIQNRFDTGDSSFVQHADWWHFVALVQSDE